MASAARRPVSSACPMPSPVIGSVAAAASPTKSVRRRRQDHVVHAGWDRPRPVGRLGLRVGAEHGRDVGARQQLGPQLLHLLDAGDLAAVALDPEADVGAAAGERERPGVAGRRSASNHTNSSFAARGPTCGEVLAEGVPLAQVAGRRRAQVLAQRRPHAVGADRVAGGDAADAVHVEHHSVGLLLGTRAGVAVVDLHARAAGDVEQRGVELRPPQRPPRTRRCRGAAGTWPGGRTASAPPRPRRVARRAPTWGRGRAPRASAGRRR